MIRPRHPNSGIAPIHNVEPVGHGGDEVAQKRRGGHFAGLLVQFHESELGGAVDGTEGATKRYNLPSAV